MVIHFQPLNSFLVRCAASAVALGAVWLGAPQTAKAADEDEAVQVDTQVDLSLDAPAPLATFEPAPDDPGSLLLAGKVGGILPMNGLDPFIAGGVEIGWIFGGTKRRIAALLDVTYTAPEAEGSTLDTRLAGGGFGWRITQKELILQPTFLYRLTGLGPVVPFAGLGPRIYLLETVGEGAAAGIQFKDSQERSTKLGVGLPLGVEYLLGPGGLMAELLLEWAPLNHRITGDASLLGATLFIGYRATL